MVKFPEFKKFFLYTLIGSLVVTAAVAVFIVLFAKFDEIAFRVIWTLAMVIFHSLFALVFIWDDEHQNTFERLAFFINVLFGLIAISFATSILGIWKVIPGQTVWHLYLTYVVVGFASLHGDILSKILNKKMYLDVIVYANYIFMVVVAMLLQPVIYIDNAQKLLGETYFRVLGANGIIDGTLSILAIIFYRLYSHSHPQEVNVLSVPLQATPKTPKRGLSIWVWILIFYLASQIVVPLIALGFSAFYRFK